MTEKTFVLHDGTDETETMKLHAFVNDITELQDWEGENSGVNLWIHVSIGDTMVIADDGTFSIRRKQR